MKKIIEPAAAHNAPGIPQEKHFLKNKMITAARKVSLILLLMTTSILTCFAQSNWTLAFRGGANVPVEKLGAVDLKTGVGFEGQIGLRVLPHLYFNTGWGWNRFAAKNTSSDYEETGYLLGAQLVHPVVGSRLHLVLGANALYNHVEVENSAGDIVYNSGHGWGWQADAGLGFPIGRQVMLTPAVRYHSLSRKMAENGGNTPADLRYVSAGLSLSFHL